mmetsp:Transcript_2800/g.5165  ORF Transcript_2800/g.5165 Transcript_2800/m.5165 type:complete len:443 (-) Transcript_2800:710-2038(-)
MCRMRLRFQGWWRRASFASRAGVVGLPALGGAWLATHQGGCLEIISDPSIPLQWVGGRRGLHEIRDEVVVRYENRMRFFATPEKLFTYFASVEQEGQPLMTAEDFILSVTPSRRRPLGHDNVQEFPSHPYGNAVSAVGASGTFAKRRRVVQPSEIHKWEIPSRLLPAGKPRALDLIDASGDGLLSFSEFLLCLVLMSIPRSALRLIFSVVDQDASGKIDPHEFQTAVELFQSRAGSVTSKRFRDVAYGAFEGNARIMTAFFGDSRADHLDIDQFIEFVVSLQNEVWTLEFEPLARSSDNTISTAEFISLALVGRSDTVQSGRAERVPECRVTLQNWLDYNEVVAELGQMRPTIYSYFGSNFYISPAAFQRVCRGLVGKELPTPIVEALFDGLQSGEPKECMVRLDRFVQHLALRRRQFEPALAQSGLASTVLCIGRCCREGC